MPNFELLFYIKKYSNKTCTFFKYLLPSFLCPVLSGVGVTPTSQVHSCICHVDTRCGWPHVAQHLCQGSWKMISLKTERKERNGIWYCNPLLRIQETGKDGQIILRRYSQYFSLQCVLSPIVVSFIVSSGQLEGLLYIRTFICVGRKNNLNMLVDSLKWIRYYKHINL